MALSDAVAAQVMGELHLLTEKIELQTERVEQVASTVVTAAKQVRAQQSLLHSQNEKILMARVHEITHAITELKSMEGAIQAAARAQAEASVSPIVTALNNRHTEAAKLYLAARDVYKTLSASLAVVGLSFFLAMASAFYIGVLVGAK